MNLEQFLEVACLFMVVGACMGWLLATSRHRLLRSLDRLLPPRYLKTVAVRRRPAGVFREDEPQ